jgi:hypothetical protein
MTEIRLILVLSALAIAAGCAPESTETPTQADARAMPPEQQASPVVEQAAGSELAGTAWRLVNITSMDDTVHVPDDPSNYTLELGTEGDTGMQADCNRGMAAEGLTAADDLTPEEAVKVEAMRREMGRSLIGQWKVNRSLYETYGGRNR